MGSGKGPDYHCCKFCPYADQSGTNEKQVEELSENLAYQSADLEQQSKASESNVRQTIDSILKSDDRLLSSLQKLASDLEPGQSEDEDLISKLRELCARSVHISNFSLLWLCAMKKTCQSVVLITRDDLNNVN